MTIETFQVIVIIYGLGVMTGVWLGRWSLG
jgi:hypothetical protein